MDHTSVFLSLWLSIYHYLNLPSFKWKVDTWRSSPCLYAKLLPQVVHWWRLSIKWTVEIWSSNLSVRAKNLGHSGHWYLFSSASNANSFFIFRFRSSSVNPELNKLFVILLPSSWAKAWWSMKHILFSWTDFFGVKLLPASSEIYSVVGIVRWLSIMWAFKRSFRVNPSSHSGQTWNLVSVWTVLRLNNSPYF